MGLFGRFVPHRGGGGNFWNSLEGGDLSNSWPVKSALRQKTHHRLLARVHSIRPSVDCGAKDGHHPTQLRGNLSFFLLTLCC